MGDDELRKGGAGAGGGAATEAELVELAKQELFREIRCASVRAQQFGAHSWAKPRQNYAPSKRFLKHMLVTAARTNDRREREAAAAATRPRRDKTRRVRSGERGDQARRQREEERAASSTCKKPAKSKESKRLK